jgi:hypothetical protein
VIVQGDCVALMAELAPGSVDAIVTDPPYGLGFMGREWDDLPPGIPWAKQCLHVLKPGGHLLAFGGTRTYHRLACAIEDAGFEIRDCLAWMYGSGFPKSLDVSKAIDKAAACPLCNGTKTAANPYGGDYVECPECDGTGRATRKPLGRRHDADKLSFGGKHEGWNRPWMQDDEALERSRSITAPATPEAHQWQGWGTALKPAHEPIVLARKPLAGTVAQNVQAYGTGALNVDGCRIEGELEEGRTRHGGGIAGNGSSYELPDSNGAMPAGRWPANVLLDPEAAGMLDEQSGSLTSGEGAIKRTSSASQNGNAGAAYGAESRAAGEAMISYGDTGGASRFFYTAKSSSAERSAGLGGVQEGADRNSHPT